MKPEWIGPGKQQRKIGTMRSLNAVVVGIVICLAALTPGAVRAESRTTETLKLIEARKIGDQASHNAFTDLIRFQNHQEFPFLLTHCQCLLTQDSPLSRGSVRKIR
jgi:hypothetical protein